MKFRRFAFAAGCLAALTLPALAETTVSILHVNDNPAAQALWAQIAKRLRGGPSWGKGRVQISGE